MASRSSTRLQLIVAFLCRLFKQNSCTSHRLLWISTEFYMWHPSFLKSHSQLSQQRGHSPRYWQWTFIVPLRKNNTSEWHSWSAKCFFILFCYNKASNYVTHGFSSIRNYLFKVHVQPLFAAHAPSSLKRQSPFQIHPLLTTQQSTTICGMRIDQQKKEMKKKKSNGCVFGIATTISRKDDDGKQIVETSRRKKLEWFRMEELMATSFKYKVGILLYSLTLVSIIRCIVIAITRVFE